MAKVSDVTCEGVSARFTGEFYHVVRWTDENGEPQSQNIHCCENDFEAVSDVLSTEIALEHGFELPPEDEEE